MKTLIEFSKERSEDINRLIKDCGVKSLEELLNNSLTMLEWAVGEEKSGRYIASVDEEKKKYNSLRMPILDKIRNERDAKINPKTKSHLKVIK